MTYALCEPGTGEIRYIGITNNARDRLKGHLYKEREPLKHIWLSSLRKLGQEPPMKCLALAYGPRCFAEQHEKAWIRVLFAHGCDLLDHEALLGPRAYVFRSAFCRMGKVASWEKETARYLQEGIPTTWLEDLRSYVYFYVYHEPGYRPDYLRYTLAEYLTFRYEPTVRLPAP